jgi:hypothetical protein
VFICVQKPVSDFIINIELNTVEEASKRSIWGSKNGVFFNLSALKIEPSV